MPYEAPELTLLSPAISALQGFSGSAPKLGPSVRDNRHTLNELAIGYADWEE